MSISIRTLKIVIGILVLVSMILSMVPMFGMGAVGRSMSKFARAAKPVPRAVPLAPLGVHGHALSATSSAPQAHKRPTYVPGYPTYNGSADESHDYGTLGVGLTFSEPPTLQPIPEVLPAEPRIANLPATALLPGAAFGAPQIPVKQPVSQEKPAVTESVQQQLFSPGVIGVMEGTSVESESGKEVSAEMPEKLVEEQMPTQAASSFKPRVIIPARPASKNGEEEILEILEDGTLVKAPEVQPEVQIGQTQIPQTQQTGHVLLPTPADTHQLVNRAEAVRKYAPVVGEERELKGELGRALSAMPEVSEPLERNVTEKPEVRKAVEHGVAPQPEQTATLTAVDQQATTETIKTEKTKKADVNYAVSGGATATESGNVGAVSSNTGTITAATTAAATAAPFVGQAVNTESQNRIQRISPHTGTTADRVVKPETTTFSVEKGNAGADTTNKIHESRRRGTMKNGLPDAKPEQFRTSTTTNPEFNRSTIVEDARRHGNNGNKHNNGGRGPRRPAPARPGMGGPIAGTAALGAPLISDINFNEDEVEESDTDNGSVHPIPVPRVHPRPKLTENLVNASNLPPERVQKRSALDDLEDKVIRDKNKMYSDRFDNLRRPDSLVEQVLPLLQDLPPSLEQPAREFIESYDKINVKNTNSYDQFISAYNKIMDAIKREREAAR